MMMVNIDYKISVKGLIMKSYLNLIKKILWYQSFLNLL